MPPSTLVVIDALQLLAGRVLEQATGCIAPPSGSSPQDEAPFSQVSFPPSTRLA